MSVRFKSWTIASTVLLGLGAAAAGHAQSTAPVQKPISIKIGADFLTNSNASRVAGTTTFSAGLDYAFLKSNASDNPTLPSVYFDYNGGSRNGGHVDTYGVGVAVRQYANTPGTKPYSPYIGLGIGAYVLDVKNSSSDSSTKTNFGGKVFAGVELVAGPFLEANYTLTGSNDGVQPNEVGIQIGDRF